MSSRKHYPPCVPCFVDTLCSDVQAAMRFYRGIFGWEFAGPGRQPGDPAGEYFVARLGDHDVAGVGSPPSGAAAISPAWNTQVCVQSAEDAVTRARALGATVLTEPLAVPPAGRLAVIADPAGAVICLWEPGQRPGAALVNEPSAWSMSLLSTDDPVAAATFYGELFGWRSEPFDAGPDNEFWLFRLPGFVGGEPQQPVPRDVVAAMTRVDASSGEPSSSWGVDFWIDDADAAAEAAPRLGGTVLEPPHDAGTFRRVVLAAPDGAAFSASQKLELTS